MAIEYKYGKVTLENSNIPDEEPVIVFRARDKMLVPLLTQYYILCLNNGSPTEHLERIASTQGKMRDWQLEHETKIPD